MRLSDVDTGRQNNMDLIRFVAASAVIYAHAFRLQNVNDPMEGVTGHSTGALAVGIFFCLSGFLIAKSLCNRPSLLEFLLARCLRILPALILVNIAVVLVAGLFWTELSPAAYFSNGRTWTYILWNSSLLKCQYDLPGVFLNNPYGGAVNGSLWTLPAEARMYGLVFAMGLVSMVSTKVPKFEWIDRRRAIGAGGFLAFLLSAWAWNSFSIPVIRGVLNEGGVVLMGYFGVGMTAHAMREHVHLNGWFVAGGSVFLAAIRHSSAYDAIFFVWLTYACLWLSYTPLVQARNFAVRGDMSYGIYIFAFPVQQCLYSYSPQMQPMTNAIFTFFIVLPLAAASFRFIEKPALRLKKPLASQMTQILTRLRTK
jgi:peptidoglycan/LPS O-acetylase OafA/YrhL